MTEAAREPPRWLPMALLAALVVPFDPYWLDFEAARRALLLVAIGGLALLRASWFAQRGAGEWPLVGLLLWASLSLIANVDAAGMTGCERFAHWWALALLVRLGQATGGAPYRAAAMPLLLLVAAIGLLQRCDLLSLGGTAAEPVSLFGNRNVAAEFVAVAAAATAASHAQRPRLAALALVLGGAYAVANGSRSALVAMPAALAFGAIAARGMAPRDRLRPLAAALLGLGLGLLLPAPAAPMASTANGAPITQPPIAAATLEVRLEIARSSLHMFADAPLLGHGPGQFAVQYPRYRSQREIELSSLGRTEQRRVGSAHDDWLELVIELGTPALSLLLAFAVAQWRAAAADRTRLLPLVAFGLLMLVRAPLGNAAAVALALLATAATAPNPLQPGGRAHRVALRGIGAALLAIGSLTAVSATLLARALATAPADGPEPTAVAAAIAPWPFDPTAWQLLAGLRQQRATSVADATRALDAVDHAVALRPFEPSYRLLRADLLRLCNRLPEARHELAEVARLDPGEPQVNVQLAGTYLTARDLDGAIAALCTAPPATLRASLATRFDEMAARAEQDGNAAGRRRLLAEASFVRALDATGTTTPRDQAVAKERFDTMRLAFAAAGLHDHDLREFVILALLAVDAADPATAARIATAARSGQRQLTAWQWSLLQPAASRLRAVPEWRELLPAP